MTRPPRPGLRRIDLRTLITLLACVTTVAGACTDRSGPAGAALYGGPPVAAPPSPIGLQWVWDTAGPIEAELTEVAGGATVVDVVWCMVEPEPGRRDFSGTDARVDAARRLGFRILLRIRVGTCWATGDAGRQELPSRPPVDLAAYEGFVEAVAARFPDTLAFGIERLLDVVTSWAAEPETYVPLVAPAVAAARRGAPGARVFTAGISSIGTGIVLVDDIVAAGRLEVAAATFDDFYERRFAQRDFPFRQVEGPAALQLQLLGGQATRVRRSLAALASVSAPVDGRQLQYFEKWQYLAPVVDALARSDPARRPSAGWEIGLAWAGQTFEEERAADDVAKLLVEGLLVRVSPLVYRPAISSPQELGEMEVMRGLYLPGGAPKPAADAFTTVVQAVRGDGLVVRSVRSGTLRGAGFGHGGRTSVIVWSDGAPVLLKPAEPAAPDARTVLGEPLAWPASGLSVGSAPVVLEYALAVGEAVAETEEAARQGSAPVTPGTAPP